MPLLHSVVAAGAHHHHCEDDDGDPRPPVSTTEAEQTCRKGAEDAGTVAAFFEAAAADENEHWLIDSGPFKAAVAVTIVANTILMGVEADMGEDAAHVSAITENIFTAVFLLELLIKLYCLRVTYFHDKANWLDMLLVVTGVLDNWILVWFSNINLYSLTVLRLLRLTKVLRIAKLVKQFRTAVLIIQGLYDAMKITAYVGALLAVTIYACAIFCVHTLGNQTSYPGYADNVEDINEQEVMMNYNPYLAFGSMGKSMLTLFNIAIFAEWTEIVRPVYQQQPALVLFFIMFALFVCFGLMNVIIGMIVDGVMDHSRKIKEQDAEEIKKERRMLVEDISQLFMELDEPSSPRSGKEADCTLSVEEVSKAMKNPRMGQLLSNLRLPTGFDGAELMRTLDDDGDGVLTRGEFTRNFHRLIDSGQWQQGCMLMTGINDLKSTLHKLGKDMSCRLDAVEHRLRGGDDFTDCLHKTVAIPNCTGTGHMSSGCGHLPSPADASPVTACREIVEPRYPTLFGTQSQVDVATCLDAVCSEVLQNVEKSVRKQLAVLLNLKSAATQQTSVTQVTKVQYPSIPQREEPVNRQENSEQDSSPVRSHVSSSHMVLPNTPCGPAPYIETEHFLPNAVGFSSGGSDVQRRRHG